MSRIAPPLGPSPLAAPAYGVAARVMLHDVMHAHRGAGRGCAGAVLSLRCASQHSGVRVSCRQTSTRECRCAVPVLKVCVRVTTTTFLLSVLLSRCVLFRAFPPDALFEIFRSQPSSPFHGVPGRCRAYTVCAHDDAHRCRAHRLCKCRSSGTLTAPGYLLRASLLGSLGAVMSILSSPGIPRASSPARCFFHAVARRGARRRRQGTKTR